MFFFLLRLRGLHVKIRAVVILLKSEMEQHGTGTFSDEVGALHYIGIIITLSTHVVGGILMSFYFPSLLYVQSFDGQLDDASIESS